jgi:hypothetical protein
VVALFVLLTCALTWPQCVKLSTNVASHADPFFSTWRLAWIAHALRHDPASLYHANIFHPDRNTLANSDAVVLQGALAAPLLWAGLNPFAVYNLIVLAGIVASGLAMFALVRYLTRNDAAAVVGGAIFLLLPYRVLHIEHLELQWSCFIPLAFLALHRTLDERSARQGLLVGVMGWLQLAASVYYGIFLALALVALTALALLAAPGVLSLAARTNRRAVAGLVVGAVLCGALTYVSAQPYLENVQTLGTRDVVDATRYSATARSYLTAPPENWIWGWTAPSPADDELQLFPGALALLLAAAAIFHRARRMVWVYAALGALLVELSFGFNGVMYPWLYEHLFALKGLRATARMSLLAFAALSVLAAFGFAAVHQRVRAGAKRRVLAATLLLLAVEYGSAPLELEPVSSDLPQVYQMLRRLPRGVVAELPMPHYDTIYMLSSIGHWYPLVNGYSGFIPQHYLDTVDSMESFPTDESIHRLQGLGVRYLIVHENRYKPAEYVDLIMAMRRRPELVPLGRYKDTYLSAELFELRSVFSKGVRTLGTPMMRAVRGDLVGPPEHTDQDEAGNEAADVRPERHAAP